MSGFPIPTKLEKYLIISEKESDSFKLEAKLKCSCGSSNFQVEVFGNIKKSILSSLTLLPESIEGQNVLNLTVMCNDCHNKIEVFNSITDGYDAITEEQKLPKGDYKLVDFSCLKCNENIFEVQLKIESVGKDDLLDECEIENWNDAFSWIWIDLLCSKCGKKYSNFVNYETS